jgi:hypothetical protein
MSDSNALRGKVALVTGGGRGRRLRVVSWVSHVIEGPRWEEQQHCQADKKAQETAERLFIQILHPFNVIESAFFRRQVAELFPDRRLTDQNN